MNIYIYSLSDLGLVFYVGKTKNTKKRLATHLSGARLLKNDKDAKIRDIVNAGRLPELVILEECAADKADELETKYILKYKNNGHPIINSVLQRASRKIDFSGRKLKPIELSILKFMASDLTTEEISEETGKSVRTIETIRRRIKTKLKTKTLTGCIYTAMCQKLITI